MPEVVLACAAGYDPARRRRSNANSPAWGASRAAEAVVVDYGVRDLLGRVRRRWASLTDQTMVIRSPSFCTSLAKSVILSALLMMNQSA